MALYTQSIPSESASVLIDPSPYSYQNTYKLKQLMDIVFHYPPELLNLLIDTIPLLCRSKKDVLLFFKGAGVKASITNDLSLRLQHDKASVNKYEMVRTVLTRLNEKGEATLRERREILKRVTEFEDFSTCWPADQLKAKGLVGEIRRVVNVKDSFTRIQQEREAERKKRQAEQQIKIEKTQEHKAGLASIKTDLFSLFGETNKQKRGKKLEGVLNRLFQANDILIREAFTLRGTEGEGIVEQIDGVISFENQIYLVEMKWLEDPVGTGDVSHHLVRIYSRGHSCGIFISASNYTAPAITTCKEALQQTVIALCNLQELVVLLEQERNLKDFLSKKIQSAMIDKNPFLEIY